jgi:hypothetical protein
MVKESNGQPTGLRELQRRCSFQVFFDELPRIRGSMDGVQEAANEARNRSMEALQRVEAFGLASVKTLESISRKGLK